MQEIVSATGAVPWCTGSSRFSYAGTTVLCTIQGPFESMAKQEDSDEVVLDVRWRDPTLVNGRMYDRYFSKAMERILHKNILTRLDSYKTIQISFNVVGEARNTLFCAVNAALLALVDGGIPLRSMFYASSSFCHDEEVFVFDDGGVAFRHSFGDISGMSLEKSKALLEYVKEAQKYALRSKFLLHLGS